MEPAVAVLLLGVVLVILALVFYLVSVILELRKITAGLDAVIGAVGGIVSKSEPVNGVVVAINKDLSAGTDLLEGLLDKKAGQDDAAGLIESVYPGLRAPRCWSARAGAARSRTSTRSTRAGRSSSCASAGSPIGRGSDARRRAMRDAELLERRGAHPVPQAPGSAAGRRPVRGRSDRRTSPAIGRPDATRGIRSRRRTS